MAWYVSQLPLFRLGTLAVLRVVYFTSDFIWMNPILLVFFCGNVIFAAEKPRVVKKFGRSMNKRIGEMKFYFKINTPLLALSCKII